MTGFYGAFWSFVNRELEPNCASIAVLRLFNDRRVRSSLLLNGNLEGEIQETLLYTLPSLVIGMNTQSFIAHMSQT